MILMNYPIVYGSSRENRYSHIAIYINTTTMYGQNNYSRQNAQACGYSKLDHTNDMCYLRPNVNLIEDTVPTGKILYLPATADK